MTTLTSTADRVFEKIKWARASSVPLLYQFLLRGDADNINDLPNHYRGSRWMIDHFEVPVNSVGEPGYVGGNLIIRDQDVTLWKLRWGDLR
jgi:hypothetical protein